MLAELANEDGLVTGSIENRTGRRLRNVRLYYGEWGYRLGTIADGARIDVGEELSPRSFKTIVTQDSLAAADRNQARGTGVCGGTGLAQGNRECHDVLRGGRRIQFRPVAESVSGLLRFEPHCRCLGRAVLVADVETAGSRLVDPESGEAIGEQDSAAVIYRFVLPVRNRLE